MPSEDVHEVAQANFEFYKVDGDVARDLGHDKPVNDMKDAVREVGAHPDQVHNVVQHVLEAADESGSATKAREEFDFSGPFEKHHDAALTVLEQHEAKKPKDWGESKKWEGWPDDVTISHEATKTTVTIKSFGRDHKYTDGQLRQVLVTDLFTPEEFRGKGGAHAVMTKVETFLDVHNLVAVLNAPPDEERPGLPQLHALYAQHGFFAGANKLEMIRLPGGVKPTEKPKPKKVLIPTSRAMNKAAGAMSEATSEA
jgi:hypothetical protein